MSVAEDIGPGPALRRPALRYLGGKWKLAPKIIAQFPPHDIYVEPFGGAASVLLRKPRVAGEIYNDLDGDLVNLFRVLRDRGMADDLRRAVGLTPFSREEFDLAQAPAEDSVERARRLLVRSFMGFSACAVHRGRSAGWRTGRRVGSAWVGRDWANYAENLPAICDRLQGVHIERGEAVKVLRRYDGPGVLHYVDPPYVHEVRSGKRVRGEISTGYTHEMADDDHRALLAALVELKGHVVLSGYAHPIYDEYLSGWRRVEIGTHADGARERTEVLWISPSVADAMSAAPPPAKPTKRKPPAASPQQPRRAAAPAQPFGATRMSAIHVFQGDSREVLLGLSSGSVDAVVTDPPYALVSIGKRYGGEDARPTRTDVYARATAGFMGQRWDTGETAFSVAFWAEVYRVLKPGGHVIAASATRTYHRLACAIEDAGFEVRDMVSWLYGSGFPKSLDVSKAIDRAAGAERRPTGVFKRASIQRNGEGEDWKRGAFSSHPEHTKRVEISAPATEESAAWEGWGTALKPACEPWVLARKPLDGTVAGNVLAHGTGALNIDGCRIATAGPTARPPLSTNKHEGWQRPWNDDAAAREAVAERREIAHDKRDDLGRWPANVIHDGSDEVIGAFPEAPGRQAGVGPQHGAKASVNVFGDYGPRDQFDPRGDSGSAARFFYSAKADAEDRLGSRHPTVKPVDLMAWLCRLVTPPGGVVLDPFAGSGSTGVACLREGFDAILVEREAAYVADIERRIAWARGQGRLTELELARLDSDEARAKAAGLDLPMFQQGEGR